MATGDIEITSVPDGADVGATGPDPGTALSTYVAPRTPPKASPLAPKEREPLIKSTLRKRWWLLGICCIVALGPAYFAGNQFATMSYKIKGELEYHGLPEMARTSAYNMEQVEAHAELLQSPAFLLTVIEKRNMAHELDVLGLTNSLDVTADSRSKMITLNLSSSDLVKGKELLDDLMEMYVQRAVEDRRNRATDHVRHAEEELFRAAGKELVRLLDANQVWMPRVEAFSKFSKPIHRGDAIRVRLTPQLKGEKTIRYDFEIIDDNAVCGQARRRAYHCRLCRREDPQINQDS